jgi:hypothetical protein
LGESILKTFYINRTQKIPKGSAIKIKKNSVTNFGLFFLWPDDKNSIWSQMIDFPKVFWDFQKWTFIFVHFRISEKGFGVKNRIFGRWKLLVPHIKSIYIIE